MAQEQQGAETLALEQNLDFQRRSWALQHLGWAVMGLLILAALLGLFGAGPLSSITISSQDGLLALQYARFWRLQSPMTLRVTLRPMAIYASEAQIWLSRAYLEGVSVQHVQPPPQRVEAGAERLTYIFSLSQAGQPTEVSFTVEPQRPGRVAGQLGLTDSTSLHFAHFIYP
jgi:hypothetical protein